MRTILGHETQLNAQQSRSSALATSTVSQVNQRPSGDIEVNFDGVNFCVHDEVIVDVSDCKLNGDKVRPLAALVPGPDDAVRFEIGQAKIEDGVATLRIFGPLPFKTDTFLF